MMMLLLKCIAFATVSAEPLAPPPPGFIELGRQFVSHWKHSLSDDAAQRQYEKPPAPKRRKRITAKQPAALAAETTPPGGLAAPALPAETFPQQKRHQQDLIDKTFVLAKFLQILADASQASTAGAQASVNQEVLLKLLRERVSQGPFLLAEGRAKIAEVFSSVSSPSAPSDLRLALLAEEESRGHGPAAGTRSRKRGRGANGGNRAQEIEPIVGAASSQTKRRGRGKGSSKQAAETQSAVAAMAEGTTALRLTSAQTAALTHLFQNDIEVFGLSHREHILQNFFRLLENNNSAGGASSAEHPVDRLFTARQAYLLFGGAAGIQPHAKFVLALMTYGVIKGLVFDCDGTLIDSMVWYWYTWDRNFEKQKQRVGGGRLYGLVLVYGGQERLS